MSDETSELEPMGLPEVQPPLYLEEHSDARDIRDAHPIDDDILHDICETKAGPAKIHYDLALVQAVASEIVVTLDRSNAVRVDEHDGVLYYQTTSSVFYDILSFAPRRYQQTRVEIENAAELVEAHTRQYLRDVHVYEGDCDGRETTLRNALIDSRWIRDEIPVGANYGPDSRGLVVQRGTHDGQN